ncbi:MAG: calcium/sodium antiporter [Sumerlaeia bacterium]
MVILQFIAGLVILVLGAEWLVRGASGLARRLGMSSLLIGLTIVAWGTSAPEMAVSAKASLLNQPDLTLGNIVGSNIFNIVAILGIAGIITPLAVQRQLIRLDVPVMIGVSVLAAFFAWSGSVVAQWEGGALLLLLLLYTGFLIWQSKREPKPLAGEESTGAGPRFMNHWLVQIGLCVIGIGALVLGSGWMVESAVVFAGALGVSEMVIGVTLVAAGTSLPELATSIVAAFRGERDIAVGNVVGSNVFNLLGVLGLSSLIAGGGVPVDAEVIGFHLPVMLAVAVVCFPIFLSGWEISRTEAALFLCAYVVYLAVLIVDITKPEIISPAALAWGSWGAVAVAAAVAAWESVRFRARRRERLVE